MWEYKYIYICMGSIFSSGNGSLKAQDVTLTAVKTLETC